MDSIKADHGFNLDSRSIRNLLTVMSELPDQDRRDFLQFVSGSPKLPIGGKSSRRRLVSGIPLTLFDRFQSSHSHVHCCLQA